jgi:hypothetical protein
MTADPPPPVFAEIEVARIRDGEPVRVPLWVAFHPSFGPLPAMLSLALDWNGAQWRDYRRYDLAEVPTVDGRAFDLGRDPRALELVPVGGDRRRTYRVVIGSSPAADVCDCRGAIVARDLGTVCKHVAGLRWVVEAGLLEPLPVGDR